MFDLGGGHSAGGSGGVDASILKQKCNVCWEAVEGECYRTVCRHLLCNSCAYRHFGQNTSCPCCDRQLIESDISDMVIGVAPANFEATLFQQLYQGSDLRAVANASLEAANTLHNGLVFVLDQITLDNCRLLQMGGEMNDEMEKSKQEAGRLRLQLRNSTASLEQKLKESEHRCRLKEKEFTDLQDAYREKLRKCQAWEKAYASLQAQLGPAPGPGEMGSVAGGDGGGGGGGVGHPGFSSSRPMGRPLPLRNTPPPSPSGSGGSLRPQAPQLNSNHWNAGGGGGGGGGGGQGRVTQRFGGGGGGGGGGLQIGGHGMQMGSQGDARAPSPAPMFIRQHQQAQAHRGGGGGGGGGMGVPTLNSGRATPVQMPIHQPPSPVGMGRVGDRGGVGGRDSSGFFLSNPRTSRVGANGHSGR